MDSRPNVHVQNSYADLEANGSQEASRPVYTRLSTSDNRERVPTNWNEPSVYSRLGDSAAPYHQVLLESVRQFDEPEADQSV